MNNTDTMNKLSQDNFYNNRNEKPHRDNGLPAVIWSDGIQQWYQNRIEIYRDNGLPAIIYPDGTQ